MRYSFICLPVVPTPNLLCLLIYMFLISKIVAGVEMSGISSAADFASSSAKVACPGVQLSSSLIFRSSNKVMLK